MDFLDRRIAEMNFLHVFLRHTHCLCVYIEPQLPWYILYYLIDFVFLGLCILLLSVPELWERTHFPAVRSIKTHLILLLNKEVLLCKTTGSVCAVISAFTVKRHVRKTLRVFR